MRESGVDPTPRRPRRRTPGESTRDTDTAALEHVHATAQKCDPGAMTAFKLSSIVLATAGRLQAMANDGALETVKESDLRSALRDSAYPHASAVGVETPLQLPYWPRVGGTDVKMIVGSEVLLAECKWCPNKDKLSETLWDVLKVASATAAGKADAGLVVAAAPDSVWQRATASALFAERSWTLIDLLSRFNDEWRWLYRSGKLARPRRVPGMINVADCYAAGIHMSGAASWTLRSITAIGTPDVDVALDDNGLARLEQANPLEPALEAAMQQDAAADAREQLRRMLRKRTDAEAIFADPLLPEAERERRLLSVRDALDPESTAWPEVDGWLRAVQMRRNMRDSHNPEPGIRRRAWGGARRVSAALRVTLDGSARRSRAPSGDGAIQREAALAPNRGRSMRGSVTRRCGLHDRDAGGTV